MVVSIGSTLRCGTSCLFLSPRTPKVLLVLHATLLLLLLLLLLAMTVRQHGAVVAVTAWSTARARRGSTSFFTRTTGRPSSTVTLSSLPRQQRLLLSRRTVQSPLPVQHRSLRLLPLSSFASPFASPFTSPFASPFASSDGKRRHIFENSRQSRLFATSNENTSSSSSISPPSSSPSSSSSQSSSSFDEVLLQARKQAQEALELLDRNLKSTTNLDQLQATLLDLEREQTDASFWDEANSARAAVVNAQVATTSRLLSRMKQWMEYKGEVQAALEILDENDDADIDKEMRDMVVADLEQASTQLLLDGQRCEVELLLSGPYDNANARLVLTAGAGGTEANDWVADLRRMYERHCQHMKVFTCTLIDEQPGDVVGYKSVELLISGPNAYGWLQGEKGAHRLVRQSPFNAGNKRQTTFAGVDVAPDILREEDLKNVDIAEKDLEITSMRSGGKGGQNVNKVNSAVRIKHLPSGIQVKCSQERSQPLNKEIALKRIKAQLLAIAQEERLDEITQVRGDIVQASWGRQIRNYVLHPYKMVKDARTGWETSNAPAFLDGGELLEECIGAYLRHKAEMQQQHALRVQEQE